MTEQTEGALDGASTEAVSADDAASETTENTEGLPTDGETAEAELEADQAKADAEEKERKSRNERRREARERAAQRERELAAELAAARAQLEDATKAAQSLRKPALEDFASFEEYQAELNAWALLRTGNRQRADALKAQEQAATRQIQEARNAEDTSFLRSIAEEGQTRFPDYMALVASPETPLPLSVVRLLADADDPVGVTYWLAQNREDARQIAALASEGTARSAAQAARRLATIEARLAAPPKPPVTSAPAPISPVKPKATPSGDPARMSFAEYKAKREQGWTPT